MATASRIPIDIRRFPWIKPFVADYAFDFPKVADFFSGNPQDSRTGKNALNDEYTDCMKLWDAGTHMTKQEWSATCRRVQSRLNQVQGK